MSLFSRFFLVLLCFLFVNISFSQTRTLQEGLIYLQQNQYVLAQDIFDHLYYIDEDDEPLYYSALCSKMLYNDDAKYRLQLLIDNYPYSFFLDQAYLMLAQIYYQEKNPSKTINSYINIKSLNLIPEDVFKLGYSYFLLDSMEQASYYFSRLFDVDSKYSSVSRYYFAHIAYKQGFYDVSLNEFYKLIDDSKFKQIVPYYISQIYFLQKEYDKLISYASVMLTEVISSRRSEIKRMLADAYYYLGDFENAVWYFEEYFSYVDEPTSIDYLQAGHSYFNTKDYLNAIKFLEKVGNISDSIKQFSVYHLAGSYLFMNKKRYALNAFKIAATFDYNNIIKEDALYNYAKLSFELDLPLEKTLKVLEKYLTTYNVPEKREYIKYLMIQVLQKTTNYNDAYLALKSIPVLSNKQKAKFQQISFFLGVIAYNKENFKKAILLFNESQNYPVESKISFMSYFWEADSYYKLGDFLESSRIYGELTLLESRGLNDYSNLSIYNHAYCFFKLGDYRKSNQLFRSYVEVISDSMKLNDSYLRIADGFFMQKEFLLSEEYYEKAVAIGLFDMDYSLYQQSVCLGLLTKNTKKIEILYRIINNHKTSSYFDNALFDLAEYYKETERYELALSYYDTLLRYTNNFELQANIYLSKGMIYFNSNKIDQSIKSFRYVVENFQKTKSFNEALSALQATYVTSGNVHDYVDFIKSVPEVSISQSKQDSLTYHTAFMKFSENDFSTASTTFTKYLENFPNGAFVSEAHFYLAESSVRLRDTLLAVYHYSYIFENNIQSYLEKSLVFLARYFYTLNNNEKANIYYMSLEKIASTNNLIREVVIRLMYINEYMDLSQAVKYSKQVISMSKIDNLLLSKANIIIARKEFSEGNYSKSMRTFEKVRFISKDDDGAEASFMISYLFYLEEDYIASEKIIFNLAENYYNDYFIAKGFLLLAKIYKRQGNRLQAKATLESIIENYIGDKLVDEALELLNTITEEEKEGEQKILEKKQSYINILEDDVDYELLYDEEAKNVTDEKHDNE